MIKKLALLLVLTGSLFAGTVLNDGSGAAEVPVFTVIDVTTPVDVQSGTTRIYGWTLFNPDTKVCFVEFFNSTATNVTLGTTIPVMIVPVSKLGTNQLSFTLPVKGFGTALSIAAVTTTNGTTACTIGIIGSIVLTNPY